MPITVACKKFGLLQTQKEAMPLIQSLDCAIKHNQIFWKSTRSSSEYFYFLLYNFKVKNTLNAGDTFLGKYLILILFCR